MFLIARVSGGGGVGGSGLVMAALMAAVRGVAGAVIGAWSLDGRGGVAGGVPTGVPVGVPIAKRCGPLWCGGVLGSAALPVYLSALLGVFSLPLPLSLGSDLLPVLDFLRCF